MSTNHRSQIICLTALLISILSCSSLPSQFIPLASAQVGGEAVLVSSFVRIENEQFSANNITTGDTIEVKAEISSLINGNLTLTMVPLIAESQKEPYDPAVRSIVFGPIDAAQWRIANTTLPAELVLSAGESVAFSVKMMALEVGIYQLHAAFQWSLISPDGTETSGTRYGRGQTVAVFPQSSAPQYQLDHREHRFNITYLVQKPYNIEHMSLDEESKVLRVNLSGGEQEKGEGEGKSRELKNLAIWIPRELVEYRVYSEENESYAESTKGLNATIDGNLIEVSNNYDLTYGQDGMPDRYLFYLPPGTSRLELIGTHVIPEFGSSPAAIIGLISIAAVIFATKYKLKVVGSQ